MTQEKRPPAAWLAETPWEILDHDGWRTADAPAWETPVTRAEFYERLKFCTLAPKRPVEQESVPE